jgi:hypothetical protein
MENYYNKQKQFNYYKEELARMVSDLDIKKWLGMDAPIYKYSELAAFNNMLDLLPTDKCFAVVLTESKRNSGHWCALLRYNNTISWMDSYGVKPDGELNFISSSIKKMLGESTHHLTRLIKTIPKDFKFEYNKNKFQKLNDHINTCGRWSVLFCKMNQLDYSMTETIEFLKRVQKGHPNKPTDIMVIDLIAM